MNESLYEKEKIAIERLKLFEPKDEPYYLCYSGGKDSDCIRILATLAGVRHEINHNLTTVDAPETVQYIYTIPGIKIIKARFSDGKPKTMWNLMPIKRMPPTRLVRWCCSELKEKGGKGRLKITGVRWEESENRKANADLVRIIGKEKTTQKELERIGLSYKVTRSGGITMNAQTGDNTSARDSSDFVHQCYMDRSVTINPIVDWSEKDVWEFLHHYGCRSNPLYQCGEKRIGCIGCPMQGYKGMKADFAKYPQYKKNYIAAFQRMIEERERVGLKATKVKWETGADVMKWWTGEDPTQLSFFDDDEIYAAFQEA